jgi:alkanesulfonate monooxygenase SsuD/methylene tetrahydromethanopterin reductase-like flavin-dependent oxidoreductase (luciferase family)
VAVETYSSGRVLGKHMYDSVGALCPSTHETEPFARRLHDLGYDRLWVGELWGRDPFVQLTDAREVPIDLATAVVNVFSRSPATIAQAAASVHDAIAGDFLLGLGTSTATAIESIHGRPFERPVRRLHETAELAGRLLGAEGSVTYEGELVATEGTPGFGVDVPVHTAALGEAARRATGRVADGWLPHNLPFDRYEAAFETIARTARDRGRDPEDIAVTPYVPCAVDEDESVARAAIRGHVAYYVGSGSGYRDAVAMSFPERAAAVAEAWADGERDRARDLVTDEMVDTLGVAATPANARRRLDTVLPQEVVDSICVVVPGNAPELVESTVEALAPA